jgi:hypothetical protein
MANRRLLEYDPFTKTTQWYHYDEITGDIGLETEQDVTAIVEYNKALYNQCDENARWSDPLRPSVGQIRYAHVPALIHLELIKITNNFKDEKALSKWMNDPANRFFRTRPGWV